MTVGEALTMGFPTSLSIMCIFFTHCHVFNWSFDNYIAAQVEKKSPVKFISPWNTRLCSCETYSWKPPSISLLLTAISDFLGSWSFGFKTFNKLIRTNHLGDMHRELSWLLSSLNAPFSLGCRKHRENYQKYKGEDRSFGWMLNQFDFHLSYKSGIVR